MEIKDYVKQFFAEQSDKVERRDLQGDGGRCLVTCNKNTLRVEIIQNLIQN